ncbi:uncharacterized protein LOC122256708 [Penaeus japonicus]|uniref:uncharacterized protein LOC122256708 n=1 Tax=Penaeus japonicus TaxID=27405 RepID=UPI001C71730B|nr:uncharacterized protein LOC122256708 [Penaeus japonicus]
MMQQPLMKMPLPRTNMAWILAFAILQVSGRAVGVKITDLLVPAMALEGDEVHLRCDYEVEGGSSFYSFKWYKDNREFYRHMPSSLKSPEDRCVEDNVVAGVNVDCWVSTEREVVLKDITKRTSGEYMCEVIGEHPKFRKATKTSRLTVYSEPLQRPLLAGMQDSYTPLDHVKLNCSSMNTEYYPDFSWDINGSPADPSFVQYHDRRTIGLNFQARHDLFRRGVITVTCKVSLGKHHSDRAVVELTNRDYLSAQEYHFNTGERRVPAACHIVSSLLLPWIYALLFSFV